MVEKKNKKKNKKKKLVIYARLYSLCFCLRVGNKENKEKKRCSVCLLAVKKRGYDLKYNYYLILVILYVINKIAR